MCGSEGYNDSQSMVARGCGWGRELTEKEQEGTVGVDANIPYFNYGCSYTIVCAC